MKTRRKPPSLVSMWMLDVFCCALGCVTLLWLLNTREASDQAKRAGSALELLAETEEQLSSTRDQLVAVQDELDTTRRNLNAEIESLEGRYALLVADRDETAKRLTTTQADLKGMIAKLIAANEQKQSTDAALLRKQQQAEQMAAKLSEASKSADEVARLLRLREKERDSLAVKLKESEDRLLDLDERLALATKDASSARAKLNTMKSSADELALARAQARQAQDQLSEARAMIIDLQGEKAKLADKYDKLQRDEDDKFAGITLSGKRVVFLIDMSGSMKMLDVNTLDPDKWGKIVDAIARVMRSLPELEKYQVVIFSTQASYLFGDGVWLDYEGERSVKKVEQALQATEPKGSTNLHAGFDLSFRLRSIGLDTIYLFSDGLPTTAPDLSPSERAMSESELTQLLSDRLREQIRSWNAPRGGQSVRIHSIGFYFESPELGAFLWSLAREHNGSFVGMSKP